MRYLAAAEAVTARGLHLRGESMECLSGWLRSGGVRDIDGLARLSYDTGTRRRMVLLGRSQRTDTR